MIGALVMNPKSNKRIKTSQQKFRNRKTRTLIMMTLQLEIEHEEEGEIVEKIKVVKKHRMEILLTWKVRVSLRVKLRIKRKIKMSLKVLMMERKMIMSKKQTMMILTGEIQIKVMKNLNLQTQVEEMQEEAEQTKIRMKNLHKQKNSHQKRFR